MGRELYGREPRQVRIHTLRGTVEGWLRTHSGVSTLHYLNIVASSQNFLALDPPVQCRPAWPLRDGRVAVATDSMLLAVELSEFEPRPGDPEAAARFKREAVRLQLAGLALEGFVHVPPGSAAVDRLNIDRHPFIALTSASVLGPDFEFAASFVAVHRRYLVAVQQVASDLLPAAASRERAERTDP